MKDMNGWSKGWQSGRILWGESREQTVINLTIDTPIEGGSSFTLSHYSSQEPYTAFPGRIANNAKDVASMRWEGSHSGLNPFRVVRTFPWSNQKT